MYFPVIIKREKIKIVSMLQGIKIGQKLKITVRVIYNTIIMTLRLEFMYILYNRKDRNMAVRNHSGLTSWYNNMTLSDVPIGKIQ